LKAHARVLVSEWNGNLSRLEEEVQRRQESALYAKHARKVMTPDLPKGSSKSRAGTRAGHRSGNVSRAGTSSRAAGEEEKSAAQAEDKKETKAADPAAKGEGNSKNTEGAVGGATESIATGHVSEEDVDISSESEEEEEIDDHDTHWGPKAWTTNTRSNKVQEWVIEDPVPEVTEKSAKTPKKKDNTSEEVRDRVPGASPMSPRSTYNDKSSAREWTQEKPRFKINTDGPQTSFSPYTARMTQPSPQPRSKNTKVGNGGNPGKAPRRTGALTQDLPVAEVVGSSYRNTARKIDLLQVDKIKYRLAKVGVSVARGTLEKALITPQVTFSDADRGSLLPVPFVGLAPYPIKKEKKVKKAAGKKGGGKKKKKK